MSGTRFFYGLLGFILVAALIGAYDEAHGTGYLWAYTIVIGLGLALANSGQLANGLSALQAAGNSGKATTA